MGEHVNSVTLVGVLHFIKGTQIKENSGGRYLRFSLRLDSVDRAGIPRHDFILVRAFEPEAQAWVKSQEEGTLIRLEGSVRASVGSGEMYVLAEKLERA